MECLDAIVIALFAGAVQGATGFGFGLVALACLSAVAPLPQASIVLVLANLSVNAVMLVRLRRHVRLERLLPFIGAALLCVAPGVWVLTHAPVWLLHLLLGMLMAAAALQLALSPEAIRPWHPWLLGVPLGACSGIFAGAFGNGGPPTVAYVASQGFDRFRYAASVQLVLAASGLARFGQLVAGGLFDTDMAVQSGLLAVAASAGALLGLALLRRWSEPAMRHLLSILLALLAIRALWATAASIHHL
jgi:uncharacterized membrane protein YfcA